MAFSPRSGGCSPRAFSGFDLDDNASEVAKRHRGLKSVEVAAFVRFLRKSRGWTQRVLACDAELSCSTIEALERGEAVDAETYRRVGIALGLSPDALTWLHDMKARDIPSESVQPEELVQVFLERLRNPDQVRRLVHKEEWRIDPEMDRQHPPTVADRVLLIDRIFNLNLALHAARWSRHPRPLPGRKSRYMTSRDERCTADKHVLDMVTSIEELGYYAYIHIRRRNVPLNVGPDIVFMARSDEAGGHRRSYIGLRSGETFDEIWRSFA